MTLIGEPDRLNPLLRLGAWVSDRAVGRRLLQPRLLAWYPRAAVGAGVLEALVAHAEPSPRLLRLVRVTASLTADCAFCVDLNSAVPEASGVSDADLAALQRWLVGADAEPPASLDARERAAVEYARAISSTPLTFPPALRADLTRLFTEREIVILATTAAQVNFWARTSSALGIPSAGFCALPRPAA